MLNEYPFHLPLSRNATLLFKRCTSRHLWIFEANHLQQQMNDAVLNITALKWACFKVQRGFYLYIYLVISWEHGLWWKSQIIVCSRRSSGIKFALRLCSLENCNTDRTVIGFGNPQHSVMLTGSSVVIRAE